MKDENRGADSQALVEEIARLRREIERLESRVTELDRVAHMDTLVPVANRRGLIRQLELCIARHQRHALPAAVLFVDVDGLKLLNDCHGHSAGDGALVHLANLMIANVRQTDLVARIGGDEFVILLDHADEQAACDTAERLANAVAGGDFIHNGRSLPLSVAIGYAVIANGDTPESVLDRADQEMYRDKEVA
jgi:diguanylate cyclase (GGDEF)-like protein